MPETTRIEATRWCFFGLIEWLIVSDCLIGLMIISFFGRAVFVRRLGFMLRGRKVLLNVRLVYTTEVFFSFMHVTVAYTLCRCCCCCYHIHARRLKGLGARESRSSCVHARLCSWVRALALSLSPPTRWRQVSLSRTQSIACTCVTAGIGRRTTERETEGG